MYARQRAMLISHRVLDDVMLFGVRMGECRQCATKKRAIAYYIGALSHKQKCAGRRLTAVAFT